MRHSSASATTLRAQRLTAATAVLALTASLTAVALAPAASAETPTPTPTETSTPTQAPTPTAATPTADGGASAAPDTASPTPTVTTQPPASSTASTPPPSAAPTQAASGARYAVRTLELTKNAVSTEKSVATIAAGTRVTLTGTSGSFSRVRSGSTQGWVPTKNLSSSLAVTTVSRVGYASTRLAAYAATDSTGSATTIQAGTSVRITGTAGAWTRFVDGTKTRWTLRGADLKAKPSAKAISGNRFAASSVTLRTDSSAASKAVRTVPHGSQVSVSSQRGDWLLASYGPAKGWVLASSLATKPTTTTPPKAGYWATKKAPLRPHANLERALLSIPAGTYVKALKVQGAWIQVSYGGKTGWVVTRTDLSVTLPIKATASQGRFAQRSLTAYASTRTQPYDKVAFKLRAGDKVTLTGTLGEWSRVKAQGKTGYVKSKDIAKGYKYTVAVYGTLRKGKKYASKMTNTQQWFTGQTLMSSALYRWGYLTYLRSGSQQVPAEQVTFKGASGARMLKTLDAFERSDVAAKRRFGKSPYKRQAVTMTDGSVSQVWKAEDWFAKVLAKEGTLISSATLRSGKY